MSMVEVKVPQLSESVAEATLLQWKKNPGDAVALDEVLIEIETKAGHGAGKPTSKLIEEQADRMAFLVKNLGI